jgi:putative inorganic carbon (HCO3(-)) transporter
MSAARAVRLPSLDPPRFRTVRPSTLEAVVAASAALVLGAVAVRAPATSTTMTVFVLLAAAFPLAAVLMGGLKRLLLAVAILNISINWDVNFAYDYDAAARGAVGGLSFSLTTMALLGLFALWLAEALAKPRQADSPRLRLRLVLPGALYAALTALSLLAAHDRLLSAFEVALVLEGVLLFLYIATFVRTERDVRFVVGALLVALLAQGLLVTAIRYLGVDLDLAGLSSRTDEVGDGSRVAGTIGSPNTAGSFLAPALVLAIAVFVARGRASRHRLAALAIVLGAVALILTFSRGAWVSFALALVVLFVVVLARHMASPRIVVLAALAAGVALAFGGAVADRLTRGTETVEARAALFETSMEVIRDHPLLGVGPHNYIVVLPAYRELSGYAYIPHNKFALVWAEAGIGALLAFLALVLIVLGRAWRAVRAADQALFPYAAGAFAAFVALLVHMNVEPFNGQPQMRFLWVLAGLATALWAMTRPVPASDHREATA